MGKKFIAKVPKKPIFKKETYYIPITYAIAYQEARITDFNQQIMLFHLTQFGGFKTRGNPTNVHFGSNFIKSWFKKSYNAEYYHFRANANFLQKFGELELKPLEKKWRTKSLDPEEMRKSGFSEDEINEASAFLDTLNKFYSSLRLAIHMPQTGITAKDRIQLSRFHGIPYLVKNPRLVGDFFILRLHTKESTLHLDHI